MNYSRQAYYKSLKTKEKEVDTESRVVDLVVDLRRTQPYIGARKILYLKEKELTKLNVSRDKLFKILGKKGLLVKRKRNYAITTNSNHNLRKYPDLLKQTAIAKPEQVFVADITYIRMKQSFCYLHLVTDAYSKKIMGFEISQDLGTRHTLKALIQALKNKKYKRRLLHHSDRGGQYCNDLYIGILKKANARISMTQDGSPYDNAVAERVNGILKGELGLDLIFQSVEDVQKTTNEAIKIYNNQRPHMSNSMLTPEQMHQQSKLKIKTWSKKVNR